MLFFAALALWLVLLLVAVGAGGLRDAVLAPRLGERRAHQVGTLAVCALFLLLIALWVRWLAPTPGQALAVGGGLLAGTLAFELGFFRLVAGRSWAELLADYNLLRGRLWPLVLVVVAAGPYLFARLFG